MSAQYEVTDFIGITAILPEASFSDMFQAGFPMTNFLAQEQKKFHRMDETHAKLERFFRRWILEDNLDMMLVLHTNTKSTQPERIRDPELALLLYLFRKGKLFFGRNAIMYKPSDYILIEMSKSEFYVGNIQIQASYIGSATIEKMMNEDWFHVLIEILGISIDKSRNLCSQGQYTRGYIPRSELHESLVYAFQNLRQEDPEVIRKNTPVYNYRQYPVEIEGREVMGTVTDLISHPNATAYLEMLERIQ